MTYSSKAFICLFMLAAINLMNCVPPDDHSLRSQQTYESSINGFSYASVIDTLHARLINRFKKDTSSRIYITSSLLQQNRVSRLHKMIINDLSNALKQEQFAVEVPSTIANATKITKTECEARYIALDRNITIVLHINDCAPSENCVRIQLEIFQNTETATEFCHLTLTPELVTQKNQMIHIPSPLGHMKKPFGNLNQAAKFLVETMNCLFDKLFPIQGNRRFLFAKTDNTPMTVIDAVKNQWIHLLGAECIAKTIIPIDSYGDQFVIRDKTIAESIPKEIQILIAVDSVEVHPGKYRLHVHALSLGIADDHQTVPFGRCLPGCHFHIYAYTISKANLVGEGFGECNQKMPQKLWPYSAKIIAERSAEQALLIKITNLLRKHYISRDLAYDESLIDEKAKIIMQNAILQWEHFDESSCQAEARFVIHDRYLPFSLSPDPGLKK